MNKHQQRRTGSEAFFFFSRVCVCLCAHERVRGDNKSFLDVLFRSPSEFSLWFLVDITPVDGRVVLARCVTSLLPDT